MFKLSYNVFFVVARFTQHASVCLHIHVGILASAWSRLYISSSYSRLIKRSWVQPWKKIFSLLVWWDKQQKWSDRRLKLCCNCGSFSLMLTFAFKNRHFWSPENTLMFDYGFTRKNSNNNNKNLSIIMNIWIFPLRFFESSQFCFAPYSTSPWECEHYATQCGRYLNSIRNRPLRGRLRGNRL